MPPPVAGIASRSPWPAPVTAADALDHQPQRPAPKRRRKPVQVKSLYREPPSEAVRHTRALIEHVQTWSPDMIGEYVWQSDLDRTYIELCEKDGLISLHWTAIGRQLGKLTKKKQCRRPGTDKRHVAYRIPKP